MNLNRRMFLGGSLSLIAAVTFVPVASSNMPRIWGRLDKDDGDGFGALFRNEPVIFENDNIGIDSHQGIVFHKGTFVISHTVTIPKNCKISFDIKDDGNPCFVGGFSDKFRKQMLDEHKLIFPNDLPDDAPFFNCEDFSGHQFDGKFGFEVKASHKSRFISYPFIEKVKATNENGWI